METQNPKFDFESLYSLYPRKGEGKKAGMRNLESRIKTKALYERFAKALRNYVDLCAKEKRPRCYVKHWSTFVNNWEDYEEIEEHKTGNLSLMERIERDEL